MIALLHKVSPEVWIRLSYKDKFCPGLYLALIATKQVGPSVSQPSSIIWGRDLRGMEKLALLSCEEITHIIWENTEGGFGLTVCPLGLIPRHLNSFPPHTRGG